MIEPKEHLKLYLSQCRDYIDYLSERAFPEEPPIIMGGFARRAYMIVNDIPMTPNDLSHAFKGADVDFFWCSKDWTDSYDDLKEIRISDLTASKKSSLVEDINEYVIETQTALYDATFGFSQLVGAAYPNNFDDMDSLISIYGPIPRFTFNSKDYEKLTSMYTSTRVMLTDNSILDRYETVGYSMDRVSLTVQVTDECQHIFKYQDTLSLLEEFDIEAAKFIIKYPYTVNDIVKIGNISDDNIYHINKVTPRESCSPFRQLERVKKYSEYGFTYSIEAQKEIKEQIINYVDDADNVYDLRAIKGSDY